MIFKLMAIDSGVLPGQLTKERLDPKEIHNLLTQEKYEKLAALLLQLQAVCQQNEDKVLADILAAAYQICSACGQCKTELIWHEQAAEETRQRRQTLQNELDNILGVIGIQIQDGIKNNTLNVSPVDSTEVRSNILPPMAKRPSLFWRLKGWWRKGVHRFSREIIPIASGKFSSVSGRKPERHEDSSLVVYCLGQFRVYNNETLIKKWPGHKCKSIFKYLVFNRESPIHHDVLMDLFWPDVSPDAARKNLYQAVYNLRQVFQKNGDPETLYIECEDGCYRFNPDIPLWLDHEAFCTQYEIGQELEQKNSLAEAIREYELAEALYEGEFLAEDVYEDWALVHRENLKYTYLDILDRLSRYYFDQKQWAICITYCNKILTEDDCREDAYRRLMCCYWYQDQRNLALRQYHLCVETLAQELDVSPMPATIELYRQIQENNVQFSNP